MADGFEVIFSAMLVVAFAVVCYLAGKGNMFELAPKMLLERLEEINKKHGEWIDHKCSLCGYESAVESIGFDCRGKTKVRYKKHNYCPNCGAKMDKS